jgi:hypothetical protein
LTARADKLVKLGKQFYVYIIKFRSGKEYIGKGIGDRVLDSTQRIQDAEKDKATSITLRATRTEEDALIEEYKALKRRGGPGNNMYNKIESPGKGLAERPAKKQRPPRGSRSCAQELECD